MMLNDISCERGVISCICQFHSSAWLNTRDIIDEYCFSDILNRKIFSCLDYIFSLNSEANIDIASIFSAAQSIGFKEDIQDDIKNVKYIKALFDYHVDETNSRKFAQKIRRLYEYRELLGNIDLSAGEIKKLTGDESILDAVSLAEKPIFDFTNKLIGGENQIKPFGESICEYIEEVIANPRETNGIPTNFDKWTDAIGGVTAGIHLLSALSGIGKSMHALNIALNVACKHKIPTVILDSELFLRGGNYDRALARISGVEFYKINKGQLNDIEKEKVRKAARFLKKQPLDFLNISTMDFDSVISLVRKWIYQKTDRNFKGNHVNALLIYDYIKLTDYADLKTAREYEILGNRMSQLHAFTVEYKLPIIAYVQQNKQAEVSQSQRLIWFSTSVSAISRKTQEEINEGMLGTHKICVEKSRWGEGLSQSNFINYNLNGKVATFTELETAEECRRKEKDRKDAASDDGDTQ